MLATYSLLPVFQRFARPMGINIEKRDISVSGRILAAFPDYLTAEQRQADDLAWLGELSKTPEGMIIKLPNISASVPQLVAAIAELQSQGYKVPDFVQEPRTDLEKEICKQFFIMYGRETGMVDPLRELLSELVNISLANIRNSAIISDHADLIDSFYSMLAQVLKKQPGLFLYQNLDTTTLLQAAISCLTMPEQHPVKSVASFLSNLISVSREVEPLVPLINNHGETLFMQVMKCVGGEASRSYIDYFTDIILALNKKYFDNLCRYMNGMVATDGFPTEVCTREQKEHFARMVLKERANKRKLQETMREFSLLSRGMIGSEYAAQLV